MNTEVNQRTGRVLGAYANEPIIQSTDWGASWAYVKRPPGAVGDNRCVYADAHDSHQVWCITGASSNGTLWKSDDGGITWRALGLGDAGSLWNIAVNRRSRRRCTSARATGSIEARGR